MAAGGVTSGSRVALLAAGVEQVPDLAALAAALVAFGTVNASGTRLVGAAVLSSPH